MANDLENGSQQTFSSTYSTTIQDTYQQSTMDAAIENIKQLASEAGHSARQPIILALTKLIYSLETPDDTVQRIGGLSLQTSVALTAIDLGLFRLLVEAEAGSTGSLTLAELAAKTGAEAALLLRLLRYLASIGLVDQVSKDAFKANHASRNMTAKVAESGLRHYFYTCCPEYFALPDHLKRTGYRNAGDETQTAWHDAFKTDKGPFTWFADKPDNMSYFNDYMAFRREPELGWLSVYPVREQVPESWPADRPLYVNIGGNIGHQCAEFRDKFPADVLPGRVILQDLPHSIAAALATPGVENMVHDFFKPQPVRGAKFYFLRGVFHNHPDHKVKLLLKQTMDAMTEESIMLIDEIIPPAIGTGLDAAAHDITMLAAFAGAERSEEQWKGLFGEVGLRLVRTYVYNEASYESVMDVRLL